VPAKKETLRLAIGKDHRRYTRRINFSKGWRGHLWQERFASFVMDEPHFLACLRYVENNPVRAKLVKQPQQWPWSSAPAHIKAKDDILVKVSHALSVVQEDWKRFLSKAESFEQMEIFRKHERPGRPYKVN